MNGSARASRADLDTPAEQAIRTAIIALQSLGSDPLLAEAATLLEEARRQVSVVMDKRLREILGS